MNRNLSMQTDRSQTALLQSLACALLLMTALLSISPTNFAAQYHVVTANSVKVRQGPGTQHPSFTLLNFGHIVTKSDEEGEWSKITFDNLDETGNTQPNEGWIASKYLKVDIVSNTSRRSKQALNNSEGPNDPEAPQVYLVTGNGVKVRSGPGTTYNSLFQLYKDNRVVVLMQSDGWSHIEFEFDDGLKKQGWTSSQFLKTLAIPSSNHQIDTKQIHKNRVKQPFSVAAQPNIGLSLRDEKLICERNETQLVNACTLQIGFSLTAGKDIKKAKVRCEAELLVGIRNGDPLKFPVKQEQVYQLNPDNTKHKMEARLETRGHYTVDTVDLVSHRCAVIAFSNS